MRKARDAETASAQAYLGLRYPLGQHIRHADKTDGAAGSHCSRLRKVVHIDSMTQFF